MVVDAAAQALHGGKRNADTSPQSVESPARVHIESDGEMMNEIFWLQAECLLELMLLETAQRVGSTKALLWRSAEVGR